MAVVVQTNGLHPILGICTLMYHPFFDVHQGTGSFAPRVACLVGSILAVVVNTNGIPVWGICAPPILEPIFLVEIGLFTGGTIWILTHGHTGMNFTWGASGGHHFGAVEAVHHFPGGSLFKFMAMLCLKV